MDKARQSGTLPEARSRQDPLGKMLPKRRAPRRVRSQYPKSDLRYWEDAVFQPKNSRGVVSHNYVVRLGSDYARTTFPTHSANRKEAARIAKAIHDHLLVNGWQSTIERFKPRQERPEATTIGQYLELVRRLATVKPATLTTNIRALHGILAIAFDIAAPENGSKYDSRSREGGRAEWLAKLDAVGLDRLTAERINRWQQRFIASAGNDQLALRRRRISATSILGQASSLFTSRLLELIQPSGLTENPFKRVARQKKVNQRYRSSVNFAKLIKSAFSELGETDPEAFKGFLLLAFAGLRRSEADALRWDSFHEEGFIRVQVTTDFGGKSEESLADVYLDPEVVTLFKRYRGSRRGEYILESARSSRAGTSYAYYRAEETFIRLAAWLREHGVHTSKPLHTLRKEFGSQLAKIHGILAASVALRHSDISVTRSHYTADNHSVGVTGLGYLLKAPQKKTRKPARKTVGSKARRRSTLTGKRK